MAVDTEKVIKRVEALFGDPRTKLESYWDTVYKYILPERAQFFRPKSDETPGELAEEVFDSTAIDAAERLANLIMARLTPPWGTWFRLAPGDDIIDEQQRETMQEPLQLAAQRMHRRLSKANFYQEFQPLLLDRIVGGTGSMAADVTPELRFRCMPLSEVAIDEDGRGMVNAVAQRMTLSLNDIERAWPKADVSEIKRKNRDPHKRDIEVCCIEEREADEQYVYTVVTKAEKVLLETRTYPVRTRLATRWTKIPGNAYGSGPGQRGIASVRALNKLVELSLKQAVLAVAAPYTVVDDGIINPMTVSIEPGEMIPVASNDLNNPSIRVLESGNNFDVSMFNIDMLRNEIKRVFMQDQFSSLDRTPRSATEVAERTRIIAQDLGASIARLQQEVLLPVLQTTYYVMAQSGELPEGLGLDGGQVKVEFTSYLAQSQWQADEQAILETLTYAAQFGELDPEAGMVVDFTQAIRELASLKGVPAKMIRTTEQTKQLLQQGSQGVAAMQTAEGVAGGMAGPQQ